MKPIHIKMSEWHRLKVWDIDHITYLAIEVFDGTRWWYLHNSKPMKVHKEYLQSFIDAIKRLEKLLLLR